MSCVQWVSNAKAATAVRLFAGAGGGGVTVSAGRSELPCKATVYFPSEQLLLFASTLERNLISARHQISANLSFTS